MWLPTLLVLCLGPVAGHREFWLSKEDVGKGTGLSVPPGQPNAALMKFLIVQLAVDKITIQAVTERPNDRWEAVYRLHTGATATDVCEAGAPGVWQCTMTVYRVPVHYTLKYKAGMPFAWVTTPLGSFAEWPSERRALF